MDSERAEWGLTRTVFPKIFGWNHLWGLRALKIFFIQDVIFNCWFRQVALGYLFRVRINVILVPFLGNGICLRRILMLAEWSSQLDQPGHQHRNRVSSPASTNLTFPHRPVSQSCHNKGPKGCRSGSTERNAYRGTVVSQKLSRMPESQ